MNRAIFNRPILYVTLLSDLSSREEKTHAVYSTTMVDEFTLRTPDALMNGAATEEIIKNCVPSIANPQELLLCDLQHLLISIKLASQGAELTVEMRCPNCSEIDPYTINLQHLLPTLTARKWLNPFVIDNMAIVLNAPTYKEYTKFMLDDFKINKQLYQLSKMSSSDLYTDMAEQLMAQKQKINSGWQTKCIKFIADEPYNPMGHYTSDSRFIQEWFNQCEVSTQKKVVEYIKSAKKEASIADFCVTCTKCNEKFSSPIELDACTIFRQKLIPASETEIIEIIQDLGLQTKSLSNDLLKMIWFMRGSVSYSEAMNLTPHDRQCISKIIEDNIEITKATKMPLL